MARESSDLYELIEEALKPLFDSLADDELDEYNDALRRYVENHLGVTYGPIEDADAYEGDD